MPGRLTHAAVLGCAALALAPLSAAQAAPGQLDTSFGTGGKTIIDFGIDEAADDVAIQSDGRILLAGSANVTGAHYDFGIVRLTARGGRDGSFGGGDGVVNSDFGTASTDHAERIAVRGGRIVVAGYSNAGGNNNMAVGAFLSTTGAPDTSYGLGTAKSSVDFGGDDVGFALAIDPAGRPVVGGGTSAVGGGDFAVARLRNPFGDFDLSFGGGDGRATLGFDAPSSDTAEALALQPNGHIVAAGSVNAIGSINFGVARFLVPSGDFDPAFGDGDGTAVVSFGSGTEIAHDLALQRDGKILLAGESATGANDFAVARMTAQGTPDPAFGTAGKRVIDVPGSGDAFDVALQPDGKILVAGDSNSSGKGGLAVARLLPNGALDPTFGSGGKVVVRLGGGEEKAHAIALQPDGKIVLAGLSDANNPGSDNDFAAIRLLGDDPPAPAAPGAAPRPRKPVRRCAGRRATKVGTSKADRIRGTRKRDVIVGLGGKDRITGLGGKDIVCGGGGPDRISGGKKGDLLRGGPGNDRILGGAGNDRLFGESGKDRLSGSAGKDRLFGGKGRDRLVGGRGKDRLKGGPGKDRQKQ